jgi:undecaprenyl-diphosphatase
MLALLAGILFTFIAREVFTAEVTLAADAWAQSAAQSLRSPAVTWVMLAASWLGASGPLTGLSIAVGLVLFFQGSHRRLYAFAATMAGGSLLNVLLKLYYQRARPSDFPPLDVAQGFSFPSGHSMGSMLFCGSLAYVLYFSLEGAGARRRLGIPAIILCGFAILLIGLSRIYLGVHFFSDVIAGFTGGLFWIGVCVSGTVGWVRWRDWRRSRRER